MVRKGQIIEILSKALYSDNPASYSVGYLDLGETKKIPLIEFLKLSENFEVIPASRIVFIMKENTILYSKLNRRDRIRNNHILNSVYYKEEFHPICAD